MKRSPNHNSQTQQTIPISSSNQQILDNNEVCNPSILTRFLLFAFNVMVVILFAQHLLQTKEDSQDLVRVNKIAIKLLEDIENLKDDVELYKMEIYDHESDISDLEEEVKIREQNLSNFENEITDLNLDNLYLKEEIQKHKKLLALNLLVMPGKLISHFSGFKDETYVVDEHQPIAIQQRHRRRLVEEKFGNGPFFIMIELEFPPNHVSEGTATKFVVETAPLELMPYTIHRFLELVSQKLYDGCSFANNPGHVIQVSPIPYFANEGADVSSPFVESELSKGSFQEYNSEYRHKIYTLGIAGRPSGAEFYINMEDNVMHHGPGGQNPGSFDADPCFARVIDGIEVLDRVQKMPTNIETGKLIDRVGIKKARILSGDELEYYSEKIHEDLDQ